MITDNELRQAFPTLPATRRATILPSITPALDRYEINTSRRIASFLGQTGHESGLWSRKTENLNHSAAGLRATFKKYFPTGALANAYARQPSKIANRVYGGRMGNGPEASGDGWKFKGRGWLQTTGKANYAALATALGMTLDEVVDYLETDAGAWMSAGFFWSTNGLNSFADAWQITAQGGRVNGKTPPHGADERLALSNAALRAIVDVLAR